MEGGALQERVEGARVCPLRSCCSESWLAPSSPRPVSWAPPEQGTVASGSSSHLRGAWSQGWSWPIHSGTGGRRVSGWVAPREDLVCQLLGAPLAVSGRWLGGGAPLVPQPLGLGVGWASGGLFWGRRTWPLRCA